MDYMSRESLLDDFLPHNAICAEIGVWRGAFAKEIWHRTNPKELHLVDPWVDLPTDYITTDGNAIASPGDVLNFDNLKTVFWMFIEQIRQGRVMIHPGFSHIVSNLFRDEYFDWVYIDAIHEYKYVLEDLRCWSPKVKRNGFIAGHDFCVGVRGKVVAAVREFCEESDWKLLHITDIQEGGPEGSDVASYVLSCC